MIWFLLVNHTKREYCQLLPSDLGDAVQAFTFPLKWDRHDQIDIMTKKALTSIVNYKLYEEIDMFDLGIASEEEDLSYHSDESGSEDEYSPSASPQSDRSRSSRSDRSRRSRSSRSDRSRSSRSSRSPKSPKSSRSDRSRSPRRSEPEEKIPSPRVKGNQRQRHHLTSVESPRIPLPVLSHERKVDRHVESKTNRRS